jgi:hypothetical protein
MSAAQTTVVVLTRAARKLRRATAFAAASLTLALLLGAAAADAQGYTADLSIAASGLTTPVRVGEPTQFEITVTNSGPELTAGSKVVISQTDTFEPAFGFYRLEPEALEPSQGSCKPRPTVCQLGRIDPGASATVVLVARAVQLDAFSDAWGVQAEVETDHEVTVDPSDANNATVHARPLVPPITLRGLPRGCASKSFSLKARLAVVGSTQTKLIVDGKVIEKSRKPKFKAKVDIDKLEGAKHTVEVVVKGDVGAYETARFKTC